MAIAVNQAGDALYYDEDAGQWSPATVAVNHDTNERVAFDGQGWQAIPKAPAPANENPQAAAPDQDNLLSSIGKGIKNIPAAFERGLGGALRAAGESAPEPNVTLMPGEEDKYQNGFLGQVAKESVKTPGTPASVGKQLFEDASAHIRANAPNVPQGSLDDYAYQVTLGLGELAPIVAAGYLTKSPTLAAAMIGGQAYAEKYGQAREEGRTITQADADAGFTGLVNGSMATLPLGVLMKPGGTFLGKAAATAGVNAFTSLVTEALQMGYDKGVVGKDMPLGTALQRLKDAGITGAVTGALLGGGEHGVERLTGRTPEAGQPPQNQPPPQRTPEETAAPVMNAGSVDEAIRAAQAAAAPEPIDIEAMGRAALAQAEAAKPMQGERGVNDLLQDLDMEEQQAERQIETAEQPSLADTTELEGQVRGKSRRITNGPVDAATLIAMNGGIRNDEGHDLVNGRGLQQFVPGVGPLIRPKGMSIDAAGEILHEQGFFGPPETTQRPTENEVLQLLEQTRRDDQGRATKVYTPDDQAAMDEKAQAARATQDNARVLQDVHDEARALGETFSDEEADRIVQTMGERDIDPQSAVVEHIERKALQEVQDDHDQTGDADYAKSLSEPGAEGEIDLGAGEGGAGQAVVAEAARRAREAGRAVEAHPEAVRQLEPGKQFFDERHPAPLPGEEEEDLRFARRAPREEPKLSKEYEDAITAHNAAQAEYDAAVTSYRARRIGDAEFIAAKKKYNAATAKFDEAFAKEQKRKPESFDFERGTAVDAKGRPVDQFINQAGAHSAKQLAAAREAQGHGKIAPKVAQKAAGGLFGEPETDEPEQGTLFARREDIGEQDRFNVQGHFSPEFAEMRAQAADVLRQRLNDLGLHDIALKVADAITANEVHVDGLYSQKIIGIAMDSKDMGEVLDHEAVHALKALNLFSKSEWSILRNKAMREWRNRYNIDKLYSEFDDETRNEEAVAEAFRYWRKGSGDQKGIVARIFDKVRNTLDAVRNGLRGLGFVSADQIFRKVSTGEVGARDNGGNRVPPTMFARRAPRTPEEAQNDEVSDLIQAATGETQATDTGARLLSKISEAGIKQIKNPNPLEVGGEAGYVGTLFPRTMASLDDMSARLWRPWMAREEEGHANAEKLRRVVSDSLTTLSAESRDRVYAALELARKWQWRPPDDGRPIRVRNTSYWEARKSKIGDDFVLNAAEGRAFHDALKLGDEGWRTFMTALARREGWKGAPDPAAIRKAANEAGDGVPEGKRLLRLADVIEAAQGAMNRPYFPAMRFGDYYIAVKAKTGKDETSLGGYPRVEWFETVEKPVLHDLIGKGRVPAADMPEVKEAIQRIRALTKTDGSVAFPEDTHEIEVGDLRSKPSILRQINLPAVEKLFMLMERGVTESLRDKIMATNTPEEGATGKEAAGIKKEAGEAAKEQFRATMGEAKDTLMDAVYHDLMSGWKKQASLVPGYSADFDRSIGTHIYQVGRNAADLIYRDDIERAYQDIVDNHPHASAKQYWQHWRYYQDNPASPLSRAAGKTAQIGAAYVMGMNPSTTIMIASHTPVMATPVLSVGGGMGQASAQMLRAIREVYKQLSFDKKRGGFIDTSKLGRTDREKALLADLEKAGLTHSVGADDVRALNDRQAGLWGQAQPTMRKALDIAMSNVSAVDQANRNAIALAAHRMAMNPATLEKMAAPWMEHNAIFRQMVMSEGLTPENFTKFLLSEAAGSWGKTNQAPAMRGAEGSLIFALHGFQTRFLSTAWKLMRNMGPEGRVAAGWMMAALWAGTGIYGLPFTQDLENAAGALWKKITGTDPMIDAHLRQFLQDAGLGKIGTEILLRGPLSVLTGIDLGSRLGFGDVITRSFTASDLLGTIPTILWGRLQAAYERERTGQGAAAAAAELLPAALRSPIRAMIEAKEGTISQTGNMIRTPDQIAASDRILRSLGLPALSETEARARSEYVRDLGQRDKELHEQTRNAWATLVQRASRAQHDGDFALAHELSKEASDLLGTYNKDHWQTPLDERSLGDAMMEHTVPQIYQFKRTPGRLKGEAYRNPY